MGRMTETVKVLLIVNVIFFIGTLMVGESTYRLFSLFFFQNDNFGFWQIITHMFMHGSFMHILFNMYALWAFGSPIEQMLGKNKFLFFYFSCGIGAAIIHSLVNYFHVQSGVNTLLEAGMTPGGIQQLLETGEYSTAILQSVSKDTLTSMYTAFNTPAVGASGAIYGILVAFGMLFPNVELFLLFVPIPIKAKIFIPILIAIDLFSGFTGYSLFGGGIAHFAHVGGALFGFIMMWYWKKNQFNQNRWD
ncbi:rhomboid family intramembrane serine protease [Antarcticibacterium sp. 1MA-6-2]|uniref:rhomboid family intramembrane serine protease n=1 Tax=Antarcticibacterium sp. 1MA-6-2 TaxID=2908210 RepID=UPI001F2AC1F1|nr:rhomboid family intramembrane serine protease [Antarcticibacterium sp. 1MA-6-2]UJH92113.1 rhomboid family intramembrane serine protease [Antarcticibacterium sp. 1MA-6-2]